MATVVQTEVRTTFQESSPTFAKTILKKQQEVEIKKSEDEKEHKREYCWRNIAFMIYAHTGFFVGIYYMLVYCPWLFLYEMLYGYASIVGVTGGAHRLWCHRSYKAKWPMRLLLCFLQTTAFQNHIYEWSRDHRVHHKFAETNADPHNAKRGFFFCHVGWLLVKKHPDVKNKGKTVDLSDLLRDPIVYWQRKFYPVLMPLCAFALPTVIPMYFWGVDPWVAWYGTLFRWVITVNGTWTVNSFAHLWGPRPYDKNIYPSENKFVIAIATGEGYHNYHHTFPYDYKAAELKNPVFNFTARFIDFFAWVGWAYDLKQVPYETVKRRIERTGDGSHYLYGVHNEVDPDEDRKEHFWGWGDKDMTEDDYKIVSVVNKKTD